MSDEECAVKDSIVFENGMGELGLGTEGVLRRASRSLTEQAIETVESFLLSRWSMVVRRSFVMAICQSERS